MWERQTAIREAYRRQSEDLQRSPNATDRELAARVRKFVAEMPEVKTNRDRLLKDFARVISGAEPRKRVKGKERGGLEEER